MAKRQPKWAGIVENLPKLPSGRATAIADGDDNRESAVERLQAEIKAPPDPDDSVYNTELVDDAFNLLEDATFAIKRSTAGRPWASEYARAYADCRRLRDRVKALDGMLGVLKEALEGLVTDQMENEGTRSLTLEDGASITVFSEPFATIEDREAFRLWCVANGYEKKLALAWSTMNAINKERLFAGEPEADGVKSWAKTIVRLGSA